MLVPIHEDPRGRSCWMLKTDRYPPLLAVRFEGELRVMDGLCPHVDAPLVTAYITDDGDLYCPLHFWRFDPRTGAGLTDPGQPLRVFEVVDVDGVPHAVVPDDDEY